MKLPDYNAKSQKWDRYKRFYNDPQPWFILFESGEALITKSSFTPHERRLLRDTDLQIVSTGDDDCPRFSVTDGAARELEGAAVPKNWLQVGCSQTLLLDKTTGRAVRLDTNSSNHHEAWKHTPAWVHPGTGYCNNAVAYMPGNNRDAIASKVMLKVPVKPSKEERRALHALGAGCTAWCSLSDWNLNLAPAWCATSVGYRYTYQCPFVHKGEAPDITDLSPEQRFQIAKFGYATNYKYLHVDSLQEVNTNQEGRKS